jgi:hypothetical protein
VRSRLAVSERRTCAVVGQPRATQRRRPQVRDDEAALTSAIERLATQYGRYGYRRIRRLLVDEGWRVNVKRVWRIWRREGLKVPKKQPKRGRLWLNDGSCVRLRPERPNHVWSYDFVQDRTEDGRTFRMLCVIDEFTRRCLAIVVARFGRDYSQGICNQLWDAPQVNFDGKMLGCCRNFWGDFGSNAFTEGLAASVNSEKMTYARKMLRGDAASREDIPCATCEIYLGMQRRGKWLERPEDKKG